MSTATEVTVEQARAVYEEILALLAAHGWRQTSSYLCDYTSYQRGVETLHLRWGYYAVMRPTWAEIQRPRLVGETTGVPEWWTGRMPDYVTVPLPRKGLLEALRAAITADTPSGPFQQDDGYWDDAV